MDVPVKEWHPRHEMAKVSVEVELTEDGDFRLLVVGTSRTKRTSLWRHAETYSKANGNLAVSDWVAHHVLVALQDTPTSAEAYQAGLRGWEEVELPLAPY